MSNSEIDDSLYSRQRYVLGDTAMHKLAASNVFLFGLNGVGVEIAKNLILAGVKSVTIHDICQVSESDMSCQFYVKEEDITFSKSRGRASLERLAELNVYVNVKLHEEAVDEKSNFEFLADFQCVVMTGCSLELQLKVNKFCRQQSPQIKFITADVYGLFCWTFCDFGDEFEVIDQDGEEAKEILIGNITKSNPGLVTTADSIMHGLQTGDVVTFQELTSMKSLNGAFVPVTVLTPFSFTIMDTTPDHFTNFTGRGIVKRVKTKSHVCFKSLEQSLGEPSLIIPDFGKPSSPTSIFNGMTTMHKFLNTYNRMPKPWNTEDSKVFLSMAEDIFKQNGQDFGDEEKLLIECLSFTCQGRFPPLCAFLGGVSAQEVLKALSGKFEPLQQWLLLDAIEVVKDSCSKDFANYQPLGDRYDDLRICIGEELCKQLRDAKIFMVGCGAIGCELLKNFALLGIGCDSGLVIVTDNDLIEKSNLNRQFLFRSEHIRKPKSVMAASSTLQINPKMNIVAQQHKVGWETEAGVYPDTFYKQLDVVVNALDNVEARRYVDRRCVSNQKPLLESGTLSTKGHVQVVKPFETESYTSQNDPDDSQDVPYCTLRSFPANMEHCIEWARDKFETIFVQRVSLFNEFWKKFSPTAVGDCLKKGLSINHCKMACKMACNLPCTWQECISLARICFEKWFNFKPKELLLRFPLDTILEDGSPFWQLPKRPPSPITFDPSCPLHMTFVISYARLMASTSGLKVDVSQDSILDAISKTYVPTFEPKNKQVETDESAPKPQKEEINNEVEVQINLNRLKQIIKKFADEELPQLSPERFEKDDDSNGHIDFIASTSNLRATVYGIAAEDRLQIKRIAGRIVPAIATTTAAVSALVTVELVKIIKQLPLCHYKNAFLNLARNIYVLSEPGVVRKNCMKSGAVFSIWDRWEITGNTKMTLDQFMKAVKIKYNEEPTFIVQGTKLLYSSDMLVLHKKRLHQKMSSLLKIVPKKPYVDLVVSFKGGIDTDGCAEDESGPEVRYYHGITEN